MAEEGGAQPSLQLLLPQKQEQQHKSIPEQFMHKNRLQEYTQRANISFPVYHTVNKGVLRQPPKYLSTVQVDGETYTSLNTFSNRKAAEQEAARLALEGISKKIKNCVDKKTTEGGFPPIYEDKVFCKSILHEFAAKMNIERPKYDTNRFEGLVPVFVSSLIFKGVKYVGQPSTNKKEAEQFAARAVILSILANPGEGIHLSEIVKSKAKLFSAVHEQMQAIVDTNVSHLQPNIESSCGPPTIQGDSNVTSQDGEIGNVVALTLPEQTSKKGVIEVVDPNISPLQPNTGTPFEPSTIEGDSEGTSQDGEIRKVVSLALPEQLSKKKTDAKQASNGIGSSGLEVHQGESHILHRHIFKKPELETISEAVSLPIAFVPSLQVETPLNASACVRKRKCRRKKKVNKKAKTDIQC